MLERLPPGVPALDPLEFARYWRARDHLQWSVRPGAKPREVVLQVASQEAIRGITFEFAGQITRLSGGAKLLDDRRRIVLGPLEPGKQEGIKLTLR